jgi:hypothetical protein
MNTKGYKMQGPWGIRFLTNVFMASMGVLVFWLLGFLIADIESIKGPNLATMELQGVEFELIQKNNQYAGQIAELDRQIASKQIEQSLASDSAINLQRTISPLMEMQKLSAQNEVALGDQIKGNLADSVKLFLTRQTQYQDSNQAITDLTLQKQKISEDKRKVEQRIQLQRQPVLSNFQELQHAHRLKLTLYHSLVLVPLVLIAGFLLLAKRNSIYFPLFLGFGVATLIKSGMIIHEYCPTRYSKYVIGGVLLIVVVRLLVYFIKMVAFPKSDWLAKQYREAYERFLCPICDYPMRIGPRKYLFWTRRTVHSILPQREFTGKEEPYTCPACGTHLLEPCPECKLTRHSLLPYCEHCGAKKEIAEA